MTTRRMLVLVAALALLGAACTGGNGDGGTTPAPAVPVGDALNLKSVCPNPIVVQTDWQPQSEHGFLYNLVGNGYKVDTAKKKVTGPLVAQGHPTGVNIEIRTGGPAVGFEPVPAVMYADPSIHLGYVATDEAVQFSAKQPTTAVFTQMDISPLALMWSPDKHPTFNIIADIGQTDTTVLYTRGLSYMNFLVGSGILRKSQLNASYDGSPAPFMASGGEAALQGFATSEPYLYQHEIKQWGKPLKFQLINDAGFPVYFSAVSVRVTDKAKLALCLAGLVPILQRSQVDFIAKPAHAIGVILDLVKQYHTGWQYSRGRAEYSAKALTQEGIVTDGTDGHIGDFDMGRVQKVMQIMGPILAAQRQAVKEGLKPEDLATNEFIDPRIGLGNS